LATLLAFEPNEKLVIFALESWCRPSLPVTRPRHTWSDDHPVAVPILSFVNWISTRWPVYWMFFNLKLLLFCICPWSRAVSIV
jgi:hypothetical protein